MSDRIDLELKYGLDQKSLFVTVDTKADPAAVSNRYITVHLPTSENYSKASFEVTSTGKAKLEVIYDRLAETFLVNALITAGSSTYDVVVTVSSPRHTGVTVTGITGIPIQVPGLL
jgi:uncharacterized protein YpuA (DUF1002 family)